MKHFLKTPTLSCCTQLTLEGLVKNGMKLQEDLC